MYSRLLTLFCLLPLAAFTQTGTTPAPKKEYTPTRITAAPHIDGVLDDECWKNVPEAANFVQFIPEFGKAATFDSKVKLAYDDNAIYVGALLLDPDPSKIGTTLTQRDVKAYGIADVFVVGFDTYLDGVNAFRFELTAANSQTDGRLISPSTYDLNWDAVWESNVKITEQGWVAEIRIPFSALRFPKKDVQSWGLQFSRGIQRLGEINAWNPVDPRIDNLVQQWGILKGLEQVDPPLRLSFTPFAAAYAEHVPVSYSPKKFKSNQYVNGGVDIKWGVNQSFTVDMTLIPDFGQVQSDNTVFNLSPFEVKYDEKRPFFTEGIELFKKGDIFYSRRIGARPAGYDDVESQLAPNEEIVKNPNTTTLYNATKFTGRTTKGLGIGVLNAVSSPMYATIKNQVTGETRKWQTSPLTNQNVLVFDQNLKNNSSVTFTNTSMIREGSARDANVTSLLLLLNDKNIAHRFTAQYRISRVNDTTLSPRISTGHTYSLQYEELNGIFQYTVGTKVLDDKWDPNDMGILNGNNVIDNYVTIRINDVRKRKHLQSCVNSTDIHYQSRFQGLFYQSIKLNEQAAFTSNKFVTYGTGLYASPFWSYDYYEPRVAGKKLRVAPYLVLNPFYNSDPRKKFSYNVNVLVGETPLPRDPYLGGQSTFIWRMNAHITFQHDLFVSKDHNNFGYVRVDNGHVVIGRRNINVTDNALSVIYNLTARMNINLRARHYWTKVVYNRFYYLNDNGRLTQFANVVPADFNYNVFNVDCVYSWQFAPGSFLNLIWKNNITQDDTESGNRYLENFRRTLQTPQANSVIIKLIYYLEYQQLRKALGMQKHHHLPAARQ